MPLGLDAGGVEIADPALVLSLKRGAGGERQLLSALAIELLQLGDPDFLRRIAADQPAELLDLVAGELPVARIEPSGLGLFVEDEPAERGFGPGDGRADVADDQRDVIGMAFGVESALTGIVGVGDEEDHQNEDQRGHESGRSGAAAPPVEADLVPVPDHCGSLDPLTFA